MVPGPTTDMVWDTEDTAVINSDEIANAKEELINETCNEYRGTSNYQVCLNAVNNEFDKIDDALQTAGPISLIFVVVIAVATIVFDIWTIFVAKNAKKEIEAER